MPTRPTPRRAPLDQDPHLRERLERAEQRHQAQGIGSEDAPYDLFEDFEEHDDAAEDRGFLATGAGSTATHASRQAAGAPRWAKITLYSSMVLGLIAVGLLIATASVQLLVSSGLTVGGANLLADTPEAAALRRELLWGPLTLPLIVLALSFLGLCVAGLSIFRARRR